jgi:hypothetical protein
MIVPDTLDTFDLPAEAPYTVDELHQMIGSQLTPNWSVLSRSQTPTGLR